MEKHHGHEHERQERKKQTEHGGPHPERDRADYDGVSLDLEQLEAKLTAQRAAGEYDAADKTMGEIKHLREQLHRDENELTAEA